MVRLVVLLFFSNTSTTAIYTLSLHDALPIYAFHESFGDMTAVLVALHDDALVKRLLTWSKGDLRLDNFVTDRKSTRLNSSHSQISYAVFCLKKKIKTLKTLTVRMILFVPVNE